MRWQDQDFKQRIEGFFKRSRINPGGDVRYYEEHGRNALIAFIMAGGFPDHKVLEVGCGALRVGWQLISYLKPGNYTGTEKAEKRAKCHKVVKFIFDDPNYKKPVFDYNTNFTAPGEHDWIICRSILSHVGMDDIKKIKNLLDGQKKGAKLLATIGIAHSKDEVNYDNKYRDFRKWRLEDIKEMFKGREVTVLNDVPGNCGVHERNYQNWILIQ